MPYLSVIVPAYNSEATLERCIRSVLDQSFVDLELLAVDDGSTDSTPALLRQLAEEDGRVRVFTQPNGGVSAARNLGLSHAQGTYVAFLDADDWLDLHAYEKLTAAMRESGASCAACGHWLVWPDGRRDFGSAPMDSGVYSGEEVLHRLVLPLLNDRLGSQAFNGFSVRYLYSLAAIRRRALRFTGAYLEDELFLIEFFSESTTLCVVNEGLYYYFQNPESATRRYMSGCVETFLGSLRKKRELVERFRLEPGPDWERNCAWAGLLIAVGNEFAPGSPSVKLREHKQAIKELCRVPEFRDALENYVPRDMNRRKTLVAALLRLRLLTPLCLLYLLKNRGRGERS
jgi:glycosyltransferase EpsJ